MKFHNSLAKAVLFLLYFLLSNHFVSAQDEKDEKKINPILTSKFDFEIGVFIPTKDVKIAVNGSGIGDEINFDEVFGFKQNEITPNFNFNWRFSEMWRLSAEMFKLKTSQKAELDQDVPWGDLTFKKGTFIKAGYGLDLYRIYVGRVIFKNDRHELGGGLGFHAMNLSAFVEGRAYIETDDDTFTPEISNNSVSTFIPLPNIGFFYTFAINEKWALSAKVDWFGIQTDGFGGSLWDIDPKVNFQFSEHFGARASYRFYAIDVNVDKILWKGSVNMNFQGPTAGVYYAF